MLLHNPHKLRNKSLQMEDDLRTHPNSMLVKRRPLDNIRLQRIIDEGYKLERQSFEDSCGRNAMSEEIVEFSTNLQDPCRGVLLYDLLCNLADQGFPIWGRDGCFVGYFLTATRH